MNYTETQIEAIKLFGRKDLSFGCWIKYGDAILQYSHEGASCHIFVNGKETGAVEKGKEEYIEILGHIPHLLPDVARVAKEKGFKIKTYYTNQGDYIVNVYGIIGKYLEDYEIIYNPTLPLLDQPNLSDIISLFR